MGKILLYYKYVHVPKPSETVKEHKKLCDELGLKGRILIAQEGINGTVGGSVEATEQYKEAMNAHPLFSGMDFKESEGSAECFPKMKVAAKSTIVNLGVDPRELTAEQRGTYLSPKEAHTLLTEKPDDLVILDARNNYEWRVGTFEGAVNPDIDNFRDLPEYLDENLDKYKDKRVLMFCTGGIRCERATGYLKEKNIAKEVYHIEGGIHSYVEQYPEGHFRGKNYVFDSRITQKINDDILGTCDHCNTPNDDYTNCVNAACNKQIIVCPDCVDTYHNTCSDNCAELVKTEQVPIRVIPKRFSPTP